MVFEDEQILFDCFEPDHFPGSFAGFMDTEKNESKKTVQGKKTNSETASEGPYLLRDGLLSYTMDGLFHSHSKKKAERINKTSF